ncbi:MAG: efflux RND transporter periplasmic adaptor subunit [Planctomycetaceae bacterium]|nr:efflux RND transporter periplasmic adaptor subunit [Planctomycetaceae bacterium]
MKSLVQTEHRSDLLGSLRQSLLNCHDFKQVQLTLAGFVRRRVNCPLVAWYCSPQAHGDRDGRLEGLACPLDGIDATLRSHLKAQALDAVKSGTVSIKPLPGKTDLQGVVVPLRAPSGEALVSVIQTSEMLQSDSADCLALVLAASLGENWWARRTVESTKSNAACVAALIEIISRTHSAHDSESACQRLADQLQEYLQADAVFVGLCRAGSSEPRLVAISGEREFDALSENVRLTEAALHESVARAAAAIWPSDDLRNRHALLSHKQVTEKLGAQHVVSVPLISEDGSRVGAILASFRSRPISSLGSVSALESETNAAPTLSESAALAARAETILRAGMSSLTSCLEVIQRLADSRMIQLLRKARQMFNAQRARTTATVATTFALVLLLPFQYAIHCECELQPIERRYVAAPFAGPLEHCLVEPGDIVEANELLARMDAREVRWELAGIRADLNKATKERNTHLTTHEFGDAAIARHEVERLQKRNELLEHRDSSLEIRSPIAGLVVTGDHREAEGVPLEQGQTLFEVAPLDRMVVEVAIPEEDVRHAQQGMKIRIQLDAVPERITEAVIRRIHPRAELRDNENVFIAEAELENDDRQLRPGMRGRARVYTTRRPLGWSWFHKPFAHILGWLGW